MGIYKHSWGNAPRAPHGEHSWKMSSLHKTAYFLMEVCVFKINEMFLQSSKRDVTFAPLVVILVWGSNIPLKPEQLTGFQPGMLFINIVPFIV